MKKKRDIVHNPEHVTVEKELKKTKIIPEPTREFKYIPVPPEPEIAAKVKEAIEKMKDAGVDLPIVWKKVEK